MPAVTVEDTTTLPRVPLPAPGTVRRRVRSVTTAPSGFEGEGFPVRRAFAGVDLRDLDPFIHMDQMGEVEYAPGEPKGTAWHPHRGFETVTYIIDGTFEHADSHGGGGTISNGDTQWMTAGGGVLHIERPPEHLVVSGGLFHGLQLWVNLPRAQKWVEPRYQDLRAHESVLLASRAAGALLRVIAGDVAGQTGPGSPYTPMAMVHATVAPGATLDLPWRPDFNALVYVLSGAGSVGIDGHPVRTGQLAVFGPGDTVTINGAVAQESRTPALDVVILGGQPIREPIAMYGPFVMNTRQEVQDAFTDFQAGRLGSIPASYVPHGTVRGETGQDAGYCQNRDSGTSRGDRHEQSRHPPHRAGAGRSGGHGSRAGAGPAARQGGAARREHPRPPTAPHPRPSARGRVGVRRPLRARRRGRRRGHAGGATPAHRAADGLVAAGGRGPPPGLPRQ